MSPAEHAIADPGSFAPMDDDLRTSDPLEFPDYARSREGARARSEADESVVAGPATVGGIDIELALFDFGFLGGSMGEVAGERLARAIERAADRRVPFVLRTSTGGARMQEGMTSLVQMPKTIVARRRLAQEHVPYIAVLGHPTTGGVLASLASVADVTVAEADATIGFAGPRVAQRFTGEDVEGRSHTATTAFTHGLVDDVVPASDAQAFVARALKVLAPDEPQSLDREPADVSHAPEGDPWELVSTVRERSRSAAELLSAIGDPILPLRGDRAGRDDPAVLVAIARVQGRRVMALALDAEHGPGVGAYRKARRAIAIAGRLDIPIVTLVDTRGADPSSDSENEGVAWEIGATFDALLNAPVPTLGLVVGEGGSGGALAFASTDLLLAMETSIFSVIAPEGAAEILWRDGGRAPEAAALLKLGSHDLVRLGIGDGIVADADRPRLGQVLAYHLDRLESRERSQLLEARFERWRRRI